MTLAKTPSLTDVRAIAPPKRRWSWAHYLALIGAPILFLNVWTVSAWLADGPRQITAYRDHNDPSWYAARFYEGVMILVALAVIIYLIRGCVRERQFLTWDVMFCLCGATMFWADAADNFFQPVLLYSSQWINLTNPCGHMPFVVNPHCGAVPDAFLFNWLAETFALLGAVVVVMAGLDRLRLRKPHLSTAQLFGVVCLIGVLVDLLLEVPIIALGLWTYTASVGIPFAHYAKYALVELIEGGLFVAFLIWLRYYKNDRGETLAERGLGHLRPGPKKALTLLAMYGFVQLVTWVPGGLPMQAASFYQRPWPKDIPTHLLNGICDLGNVTGTNYGPCPASAGFRMPGRQGGR